MITVVTGAGISEPSGIPVYRNGGAGWDSPRLEHISHYTRYGNHLDELWEFWTPLFEIMTNASPNAAHWALSQWDEEQPINILTQNIDGLHQSTGTSCIDIHGTIWDTKCIRCKFEDYTLNFLWTGKRMCPRCHSDRVRPAVTLFGEPLSKPVREALSAAKHSDTVVFIGTSGNVWPVAALPQRVKEQGGKTILINQEEWGDFDEVILGDVVKTVPEFVERINNEQSNA